MTWVYSLSPSSTSSRSLADRGHAAVDGDCLPRKREAHFAFGERSTAGGGPGEGGGKQCRFWQKPLGVGAEHLVGAHVQQLLGGGIHGQQPQIRVEQQHGGGEVVDDGLGAVHGLTLNPLHGGPYVGRCVGDGQGHDIHDFH
jgi:hypothetical protein